MLMRNSARATIPESSTSLEEAGSKLLPKQVVVAENEAEDGAIVNLRTMEKRPSRVAQQDDCGGEGVAVCPAESKRHRKGPSGE